MARAGRGFTLVELLVALSVFGVLSVLAYNGLDNVMEARRHSERETARLAALQTAFLHLSRDIEQAVGRGIRDEYGDAQAPLASPGNSPGAIVELTRAGWRNPTGQARSGLQRVAYGVPEGRLVRWSWYVLDRAQDSAPLATVLLDGVERLDVRYLDAQQQWHSEWPPLENDESQPPALLPSGVEIALELRDWGRISRLYALAQPRRAVVQSGGQT